MATYLVKLRNTETGEVIEEIALATSAFFGVAPEVQAERVGKARLVRDGKVEVDITPWTVDECRPLKG